MKIALAALLALTPVPSLAHPGDAIPHQHHYGESDSSQPGYSNQRSCFKTEYREEYVPGTLDDPGYVKSWNETLEVPCKGDTAEGRVYKRHVTVYENVDTNDCSEGTVAGGLLGGGLAGFGSRGKDRWWAIPAGIIGGSMIGCAIDGG